MLIYLRNVIFMYIIQSRTPTNQASFFRHEESIKSGHPEIKIGSSDSDLITNLCVYDEAIKAITSGLKK